MAISIFLFFFSFFLFSPYQRRKEKTEKNNNGSSRVHWIWLFSVSWSFGYGSWVVLFCVLFLSHFFSGFLPATRPDWDQMYFYLRVVDPVNQSLKSFENQKKYDSLFVLMAFWCI
jgi:hypothetical protein